MKNGTRNLFASLASAASISHTRVMKLAAIWMDRQITLEDGTKTRRISPLMKIRVVEGFVATEGKPTHYVNECRGTIDSSKLYLDLIDIETDQPSTIQIK